MLSSKEQKNREDMKTAWEENDLLKLIALGFSKFMDILCGNSPLPFQKFLEYTGDYFDQCILDISRKEHLNYIGGKMILELKESRGEMPATILLSADLYFQRIDKQWVEKKRQGQVSSDRFRDWDTDADAIKLQESGKLELSIEPPEAGVK